MRGDSYFCPARSFALADTSSRLNAQSWPALNRQRSAEPATSAFRNRLADNFGALQGLTITSNPRRKQIKKPTARLSACVANGVVKPASQTTLAKLASIVPTPMGLNDSPNGYRTSLYLSQNGPTNADPRSARLSSRPRDNASGVAKYLSRKHPVFSRNTWKNMFQALSGL